MAICIPPQGGTTTGEEEVTLYADWPSELAGKPIGTALKCTAIPNPGWAFSRWEWDVETWDDSNQGDTFGYHLYSVGFNYNKSLPAIREGFANWDAVVSAMSDGFRRYRHRRSRNLRAIFSSTGDDGGGSSGGGSSGGSAKYYAAVSLSVRGEAARNAGCKVSVSGEPFALDSQSCVVLDSPGEVAFTLAYKESAQFKFSEYQDENGNTVISPVILTASTSGAVANIYAIFEGDGRQILHGASNTILHGRNGTILHLE